MALPASEARYDLRHDEDSWTVYDVFTGLPAEVNGVVLVRMEMEDADDLVDLLNRQDARQRGLI